MPLILGVLAVLALAGVAVWQWTEIQDLHQQVDTLAQGAAQAQATAQAASQAAATPGVSPVLSDRLAALDAELQGLQTRLKTAEDREPGATVDLAPLAAKIAALEARKLPDAPPPVDLAPLEARITALEARKLPEPPPPPPPVDLAPLESRLAGLEARKLPDPPPPFDDSALKTALAAVTAQVTGLTTKLSAAQETATTSDDHAVRAARVGAAALALADGKPIGTWPNAPPALAKFATAPPPTEAALRLSFETAAQAALAASDPATGATDPLQRMWQRVESLVTVRKGDTVLVGQPAAVVLTEARQHLMAGDLSGAVGVLGKLDPPAAKAMEGWRDQAQALLDARAALATLAAS